jgi:hypothetical protein
MAKRSREASKLAPYLGTHSGAPVEGSLGGDLQALINSLNAHKLSDDHDKINHTWDGVNTFNKETYFKGPIGVDSDQLVLNHDGSDVDVELQFFRTTGGPFSIFWNGIMAWTTKPFRPAELIISRISATPPETTFAGMVWVDPSD